MSVTRHLVASYVGTGWAAVVGLAFIPLYIRYLGIESYGLIGFLATLQAWISLLDLGLASTLSREMARFTAGSGNVRAIRGLLKSLETIYACAACLIAVAFIWVSQPIAVDWLNAQTLSPPVVTRAVLLMGVLISLQWMGILYRNALLGLQQQVSLATFAAVSATVKAAGAAAVLVFVSPTIIAFLAYQCAVCALESLLLGLFLHWKLPRSPVRVGFGSLSTVWRFAGGVAAVGVLATLLTQVDKLLLAKLLPLDEFGYFNLAVTVAGALAALIVPVTNVAYPKLSELVAARDEAALAAQYHHFAQLVSVGILPPALVLCFFAREIVFLWTGDALMADTVAPLLAVWVVGTAINGLMHVPYAAQLAHGWPRLALVVNAVAVLAVIPALLVLVPRYGALAAAWTWVAINAGYVVFGIMAMHRRILRAEKWKWYAQDVLCPLFAGTAAACVMLLLRGMTPSMSRLGEFLFLLAGLLNVGLVVAIAVPAGRQAISWAAHRLLAGPARK